MTQYVLFPMIGTIVEISLEGHNESFALGDIHHVVGTHRSLKFVNMVERIECLIVFLVGDFDFCRHLLGTDF